MNAPRVRWLLGLTIAAAMGGCMVGPNYVRPDDQVGDQWYASATQGLAAGRADFQTWWTLLGDEQLTALIQRAGESNLQLEQAYWRIVEARAQRGIAAGELYPTIDAQGSWSRRRASDNGLAPPVGREHNKARSLWGVGLDATWELDVFGRIRRNIESADASMQASVEDYRDVLVVLYAEVALAYIDLRTAQARLASAERNVALQRDTLGLVQNRFDAELVPELDIAQAEQNLYRTESVVPTYQAQALAAINRLSVLVGEQPGALRDDLLTSLPIPAPPDQTAVGVPAEALRQRPDVRAAERRLAAQTAQIGVAEADLYPVFGIDGALSLEATNFSAMFQGDSYGFLFSPFIRWRLFDGDRIRSNIQVQDARTKQLLAAYRNTVLLALEDVENAMVRYKADHRRLDSLGRAVAASQRNVELVEVLYRNGLTDFQNVLDAQRSLADLEDSFYATEGQMVGSLVRLYRALGGGWAYEEAEPLTDDSAEAG